MNPKPKSTQTKIDLFKTLKEEFAAPKKPVLIDLPEAGYLTVAGQGEPGGEQFTDRIGALYGAAFTVKMTRKFAGQQDYAIGKLEAQWWTENQGEDFARAPKDQWLWKLMIRVPEFIAQADLDQAVAVLLKRGKSPSVQEVKLETFNEGRVVQMLHVGPYEKECETIGIMQAFAEKNGLQFHGRHHEIYLSDPRRVPPERLRTILRHPVRATIKQRGIRVD